MGELDFPTTSPDVLRGMAGMLDQGRASFNNAWSDVMGAFNAATWKSDSARASWDAVLTARARDLDAASQVCDHADAVLRGLARQLDTLKAEWTTASNALGTDPWEQYHDDPKHPPTPQQVSAYNGRRTAVTDAVRSARLAIILAAQQLSDLAEGVSFPKPPGVPDFRHVMLNGDLSIVPMAPAFGAPNGAVYANGVPVQFTTGRAFESDILARLGITNEMKALWRPPADRPWTFPRIKGGQFRGTYPDSRMAGVLEIKSGRTSICATDVQIMLQRALAAELGVPWSLVAGPDVPVDPTLVAGARASGGGVYSALPKYGGTAKPPFFDRATGKYVELTTKDGKLVPRTLSPKEVEQIPEDIRRQVQQGAQAPVNCSGGPTPPAPPAVATEMVTAPTQVPVEDGEFKYAWDHSKDGKYVYPAPPRLPGVIVPPVGVTVPGGVPVPVPAGGGFPIPVPVP